MAGLSRRFAEAGYRLPKYMLEAHGQSMFAWSVGSFARYFGTEPFLFVCLDRDDTADFVRNEVKLLGIADSRIVTLPNPTRGQAETVYQGIDDDPDERPITIFNIDTIRPGFRFPGVLQSPGVAGYLECFIGEGANWSNVEPADIDRQTVARTSEKQSASPYCCTGLYHFAAAGAFRRAFRAAERETQATELYVAPLYNTLIAEGADIRFSVIDRADIIFSGVPAEYEAFVRGPAPPELPIAAHVKA